MTDIYYSLKKTSRKIEICHQKLCVAITTKYKVKYKPAYFMFYLRNQIFVQEECKSGY